MSTTPSPNPTCPCDAASAAAVPTNLPNLPQIRFRTGDFNTFRTALLTPLPHEQALTPWSSSRGADPSVADLGVMMAEWFAFLADILTFYNERIANEAFLRTAVQPSTPAALVELLGYRPRPTVGATGLLAALLSPAVTGSQTVTLPDGFELQSKPGPGQSPQTFELHPATTIGPGKRPQTSNPSSLLPGLPSLTTDHSPLTTHHSPLTTNHSPLTFRPSPLSPNTVLATPPPTLLNPSGTSLTINGSAPTLAAGNQLLLAPRDTSAAPTVITLTALASTGRQTTLTFTSTQPGAALTDAAHTRLLQSTQTSGLWTVRLRAGDPVLTSSVLHMAGLLRQLQPNDWLLLTAPGVPSQAVQLLSAMDVLGDASVSGGPSTVSNGISPNAAPIPILHTRLTLRTQLSAALVAAPASITLHFGWTDAAVLVDQPATPWNGLTPLQPIAPAHFASGQMPVLLADAQGNAAQATAGLAANGTLVLNWPSTSTLPLAAPLIAPITVFYDLLPVSAGKTVLKEVVGSGDATQPGQSFTLAKSPVTYLASGSACVSTIALTVNGLPWTEVPGFYNQPPGAQVFVARQDASQVTHLDFGDGVNGARLPTGSSNLLATYRYGGGAASPPAGKLTILGKSFPGLQSVANPVAVAGGSDPDPAAFLQQYAPRSVLTFGRAVSVLDFQALAAGAPGVSMASAVWSWDAPNQRAGVLVFVVGQPNVAASVQTLLNASGDPNRPVTVRNATEIPITLTLQLLILAGAGQDQLNAAVASALTDLFNPAASQIAIGRPLFESALAATVQSVPGVLAIASSVFLIAGHASPGPLHNPGEGCFFSLAQLTLTLVSSQEPA